MPSIVPKDPGSGATCAKLSSRRKPRVVPAMATIRGLPALPSASAIARIGARWLRLRVGAAMAPGRPVASSAAIAATIMACRPTPSAWNCHGVPPDPAPTAASGVR